MTIYLHFLVKNSMSVAHVCVSVCVCRSVLAVVVTVFIVIEMMVDFLGPVNMIRREWILLAKVEMNVKLFAIVRHINGQLYVTYV